MILFDMPDDRLDGLTPLQATLVCLTQHVEFAAMYPLYERSLSIHATKAQIGQHGLDTWGTGQILYQDQGLIRAVRLKGGRRRGCQRTPAYQQRALFYT
ncbi:hypothetical protein KQH60_03880 [Mycetohabitans sp. B8]|uniref:hypothetical protein n=1 Tax=Mycetohabitans sp. B8 TaxID=2841845 RepID=UPI001F420ABF|nr:hypothetical protein [Mycetohabitans sp. B8]MCG1041756.1 hypothetical protein [Mycetohabitans sp. B8]